MKAVSIVTKAYCEYGGKIKINWQKIIKYNIDLGDGEETEEGKTEMLLLRLFHRSVFWSV